MKLRHAGTIALLVWYLMLPPIKPAGVDALAPLSQWIKYKDYASVAGCTLARVELRQRAVEEASADPALEFTVHWREQFGAADCIAGEDPRLRATQKTPE